MQAYDTLIAPYRHIVDRLAEATSDEGWEVRRAYLTSVFDALEKGRGENPQVQPQEGLSAIIAALIERVGEPEIETRLQAGIYAASAKAEHRIASDEWFRLHPDQYDIIQQELTGGIRMH